MLARKYVTSAVQTRAQTGARRNYLVPVDLPMVARLSFPFRRQHPR